MASVSDYRRAFEALDRGGQVTRTHRRMLEVHYCEKTLRPSDLSRSMGWSGHAANVRYGQLGERVFENLKRPPRRARYKNGDPIMVSAIAEVFQGNLRGKRGWIWRLRDEVARAIEEIGWVTKTPNVWVVKARQNSADGQAGWDWSEYLDYEWGPYEWGGENWVRSRLSTKLLREEVRPGDLVVGYQMDDSEYGRAIMGLTRMLSHGLEDPKGSGNFNCFYIAGPRQM